MKALQNPPSTEAISKSYDLVSNLPVKDDLQVHRDKQKQSMPTDVSSKKSFPAFSQSREIEDIISLTSPPSQDLLTVSSSKKRRLDQEYLLAVHGNDGGLGPTGSAGDTAIHKNDLQEMKEMIREIEQKLDRVLELLTRPEGLSHLRSRDADRTTIEGDTDLDEASPTSSQQQKNGKFLSASKSSEVHFVLKISVTSSMPLFYI